MDAMLVGMCVSTKPSNFILMLKDFGIRKLIKTNENGKFETIEELQKLSGLGKKNIELLKLNGVLDGLRETDQLTLF